MWGRLLGTLFGFMFGRWVGAALGFYLGYLFDKSIKENFDKVGGFSGFWRKEDNAQSHSSFVYAVFSIMGHVAKSNGLISQTDIDLASAFMTHMKLTPEQHKAAQDAYREGKAPNFPLQEVLQELKRHYRGQQTTLQLFLAIQIQAAFNDGIVTTKEKELLLIIAKELGQSERQLEMLLNRWQREYDFHQHQQQSTKKDTVEKAYSLLGIDNQCDDREVKKAYRKLMQQHHPDKLISKGLPPEALEIAKQKAQDIRAAYELIIEMRKLDANNS